MRLTGTPYAPPLPHAPAAYVRSPSSSPFAPHNHPAPYPSFLRSLPPLLPLRMHARTTAAAVAPCSRRGRGGESRCELLRERDEGLEEFNVELRVALENDEGVEIINDLISVLSLSHPCSRDLKLPQFLSFP